MPTRRAAQAEQTRHEIVDVARRLFAARGYESTTIREVAAAAGVSIQTVYDSVGPKRALVVAINEAMSRAVGSAGLMERAAAAGSVDELLAVPARIALRWVEAGGDLLRLAAATSEPALRQMAEQGRRRHVAGVRRFTELLVERNLLRPGLDVGAAADTVAVLSDPLFVMQLRDGHGWSAKRVEAWIIDTLRRTILV